jgi:D-3-phosphoglycerate dehydrogenase
VPRAHALLLENVHASATDVLAARDVEVRRMAAALDEDELVAALADFPGDGPVFVGIRSKTQVTPAVLDATPALLAVGAFCIGTDQIALAAARERGWRCSTRRLATRARWRSWCMGEIIMLSRQVFARSKACHRGLWHKSASGSPRGARQDAGHRRLRAHRRS